MAGCSYCGGFHAPLYICDERRAAMVVHTPEKVVHKPRAGSSRHGKYADLEKRKAYRREWMRRRRGWGAFCVVP
jgi:hypothetical protein